MPQKIDPNATQPIIVAHPNGLLTGPLTDPLPVWEEPDYSLLAHIEKWQRIDDASTALKQELELAALIEDVTKILDSLA